VSIQDLKDEIGDDAMAEVIGLFCEECDPVAARLAGGRAREADLHFLKGAALNLGLDALARLCGEIERGRADRTEIGLAYTEARGRLVDFISGTRPEAGCR
jgi:HPt (histidine-containing phosphotransfer) domain-containing protein